jgi:UDP-N-acetyl-D-glucosamine dehydrogenase
MICIIGLGEVGIEVFKELNKKRRDIIGVDIDEDKINKLSLEGFNVSKSIPKSEIYIIATYTTEQVLDALSKIDKSNRPLVIIESTVLPGTYKKIVNEKEYDLVYFPHRLNPNDKDHHVFNLDRVMGGSTESLAKALNFYKEFIDTSLIHTTNYELAELVKPFENAYRFMEISLAEELKMLCTEHSVNFNELRVLCNTKWNINIKEAREGIGRKCLPKDIGLCNEYFKTNQIFKRAIEIDNEYQKWLKNKKDQK